MVYQGKGSDGLGKKKAKSPKRNGEGTSQQCDTLRPNFDQNDSSQDFLELKKAGRLMPFSFMKFITWNSRSLGNKETIWALSRLVKKCNLHYVFFPETMRSERRMEWVCGRLGFQNKEMVEVRVLRWAFC